MAGLIQALATGCEIERIHPEAKAWGLVTPYFESRVPVVIVVKSLVMWITFQGKGLLQIEPRHRAEEGAMVDRITSEQADCAFVPEQAPEQASEQAPEPQPLEESSSSNLGKAGEVAGKVAVAAMLASTLTATPPNEADFPLPEATPIVYVLHPDSPDAVPKSPADDEHDSKSAIWKKILEILKYLLLVLALVAGIVIATMNGCTTCSGTAAAPADQSSSSSAATA